MKYLIFFLIIVLLLTVVWIGFGMTSVLEVPKILLNSLQNLWYSRILPWFQSVWQKINSFLGKEVGKRKPEIKEEFEKEKQEMKEDIPKVGKSFWQRFKELIK